MACLWGWVGRVREQKNPRLGAGEIRLSRHRFGGARRAVVLVRVGFGLGGGVEVGERGNPLVVAGADVTDVSFHASTLPGLVAASDGGIERVRTSGGGRDFSGDWY